MQILNLSEVASAAATQSWTTPALVVLLIAGASLLRWFGRQPKAVRRDVIRLIRALRRK